MTCQKLLNELTDKLRPQRFCGLMILPASAKQENVESMGEMGYNT